MLGEYSAQLKQWWDSGGRETVGSGVGQDHRVSLFQAGRLHEISRAILTGYPWQIETDDRCSFPEAEIAEAACTQRHHSSATDGQGAHDRPALPSEQFAHPIRTESPTRDGTLWRMHAWGVIPGHAIAVVRTRTGRGRDPLIIGHHAAPFLRARSPGSATSSRSSHAVRPFGRCVTRRERASERGGQGPRERERVRGEG